MSTSIKAFFTMTGKSAQPAITCSHFQVAADQAAAAAGAECVLLRDRIQVSRARAQVDQAVLINRELAQEDRAVLINRELAQGDQVARINRVAQVVPFLRARVAIGVRAITAVTAADGIQAAAVTNIIRVTAIATAGIAITVHVGGTQAFSSQFGSGSTTFRKRITNV